MLEPPRTSAQHPAYLARRFDVLEPPRTLLLLVEKVRYSRTTPNSCNVPLHYCHVLILIFFTGVREPHHYRDSKVCRVLSHKFGVVRPYRTVSVWCAGCLCTSSGWFKHIEPRRTFPNHIITEIAKCVEFCHMSSGCGSRRFDEVRCA